MLKLNEKYTIVLENNLGVLVSRKVRIHKIEEEKGGFQKDKSLTIYYTEKGKRSKTGRKFLDNKLFIIEGWQDIETSLNDNEFICFDNDKFNGLLTKYNPVLKYNC